MLKKLFAFVVLACSVPTLISAQEKGSSPEDAAKKKLTTALVKKTVGQLDKQIVKSGEYKLAAGKELFNKSVDGNSFAGVELEVKDGWGQPLLAVYIQLKNDPYHRLTVASAGPDTKFDTTDDIVLHASTGHLKDAKEMAAKLGEKGKAAFGAAMKWFKKK